MCASCYRVKSYHALYDNASYTLPIEHIIFGDFIYCFYIEWITDSSSKFYFQQNTTMEQYQEKENTL